MIKPLEDTVVIEDFEASDDEHVQNSEQILMRLFNLYSLDRLSMLKRTPVVYAFRNSPRNCHRSMYSVSFAASLDDFRKNHLPIINNYGAPNSIVTAYQLKPENVKKGFDEIDIKPEQIDTAEMQSQILQCAYFLVLKPAIADAYEMTIRGRPSAEPGIDRIMKKVL